jgi:hypothetical protein
MTVIVVKRDGSQDHLSDDAVNELRSKLRGQLVVSDDPEASTEPREVWNAMHVDRPAIKARCAGTADVVNAVNFARERGLLVAVRGGGHSVAGLSTVRGQIKATYDPDNLFQSTTTSVPDQDPPSPERW